MDVSYNKVECYRRGQPIVSFVRLYLIVVCCITAFIELGKRGLLSDRITSVSWSVTALISGDSDVVIGCKTTILSDFASGLFLSLASTEDVLFSVPRSS